MLRKFNSKTLYSSYSLALKYFSGSNNLIGTNGWFEKCDSAKEVQVTRRLATKSGPPCLLDHLKQRIKATGPITVASYMKEALTNPMFGYYMNEDVFGTAGDFTTSPEISQMFGELVAVWLLMQWKSAGKPTLQLVELGPGRGTLMADILRVFKQFVNIKMNISVHFVEVSTKMIQLQRMNLNMKQSSCVTDDNVEIKWYSRVQDIPTGFSFFIAHEFFDALPVHLFRKIEGHWKELLINCVDDKLAFVLAAGSSPYGKSFMKPNSEVTECEICPDASVIMAFISESIALHGGLGLIIDYGSEESNRHSIRGFKDHKLVSDILSCPGDMDLTANVDFGFLKQYTHENCRCYGPITQQSFLLQMGIRERLQVLLQNASKEQAHDLISSFNYLTSKEKMGEQFKVMALLNKQDTTPVCFG